MTAASNANRNEAREQTALNTINTRFSNAPIVKNYNEIAIKAESVRQLVDGDWSGPGDLATVFEFMKGLDPTSVVRESEYASAAASGNIFKGAFARFNGQLNPNGGFLSPEVRNESKRIVKMKLDTQRKAYDNLAKEYGKQIERVTDGKAGDGKQGQAFLIDYTGAFPEWAVNEANKTQNGSAPKVGDTKRFPNGRTGRWDGKGWVAQ